MNRLILEKGIREFIVIVVGVLSALAIEASYQGWQDSITAEEYIEALDAEILGNIRVLDSELSRSTGYTDSLKSVSFQLANNQFDGHEQEIAQTLSRVATFSGSFPQLSTVVLDDLKSTGNLRLIENARIRRGVETAYSASNALLQRLQLTSDRINSQFLRLIIDYGLGPGNENPNNDALLRRQISELASDPMFVIESNREQGRFAAVTFYLAASRDVFETISETINSAQEKY